MKGDKTTDIVTNAASFLHLPKSGRFYASGRGILVDQTIYRPSWAEINLDSIAYNIKQMKGKLASSSKVMAVVKANGYGHGAVQVGRMALKAGADALAVALLEEAVELREAGIEAPVLVLGRIPPEFAPVARDRGIALTVFQKDWLEQAEAHLLAVPSEQQLAIHLEMDTGMCRTGIRTAEQLQECLEVLKQSRCIYLTGVYTHFATADEENSTGYRSQLKQYKERVRLLKEIWPHPVSLHTSNSAASIQHTEDAFDYIRFGVSLYGLYPSPYLKAQQHIDLQPAFSLHSRLTEVKKLQAGEAVSYGATYRTEREEWIGTVPVGYADGWPRKLQGAFVLIGGRRMSIVGRICMDQLMVRLDGEYPVGEQVTLIGRQGAEAISIDEVAERLDTIVYEVPCLISSRIPRIYLNEGQPSRQE